jgi:K+-sensing histidine kinase KdpD
MMDSRLLLDIPSVSLDSSVGPAFATHGFMFQAKQPDDSTMRRNSEKIEDAPEVPEVPKVHEVREDNGAPECDHPIDHQNVLKARDELLEGLAHDLKNALSSILMNTSLARRIVPAKGANGHESLSEKEQGILQMIERIDEASERIKMSMQDALDMTNCVTGTLSVQPARREVKALVRDALAQVQSQKSTKNIPVHVSGVREGLSVIADHEKVPTALARLIAFGMKVSPAASQIEIQIEEENENVLFRMKLTPGVVAGEQLRHVFDRQGKKPGLYLVRGIAEAFGGQVWATTRANGGAELGISLRGVESESKIRLLIQS